MLAASGAQTAMTAACGSAVLGGSSTSRSAPNTRCGVVVAVVGACRCRACLSCQLCVGVGVLGVKLGVCVPGQYLESLELGQQLWLQSLVKGTNRIDNCFPAIGYQ